MQGENQNTNNIFQTSTQILTHTPYNPFAPNESIENSSKGSTQLINNVHLERPYLNEIQNEGPKNSIRENNNNNSDNNNDNRINIDEEIALAQKQSKERMENERMAVEYENAIKAEIEQTTPLIS